MNIKLLLLIAVSLVIVLPIVGYIVQAFDRKDKINVNSGTSILIKNSKRNSFFKVYLFLCKFSITSGYITKISRRYEVLCPGDTRSIAAKTMKVAIISWLLCIAEVLLIYSFNPNLHNAVLAMILIFVINNEVINYQVSKAEIDLLEEMAVFISDVRHNYHSNRMVDDAILSSLEGLGYEMKVHAGKLYEIINSNDLKEDLMKYNSTSHNKYLKMFLSLCISVITFDDKKMEGQLLFTINLQHLKREINIEILKLKKLKHVFSGTIFVTIAVCLPMDAIHNFGTSLVPELEGFYQGRGGTLFVGAIFLTAVIVYLLINNLKEIKQLIPKNYLYLERIEKLHFVKKALNNFTEKNYGKMLVMKDTLKRVGEIISPRQLLLKRMIVAIITFSLCIGLVFFMHYNNRKNITSKVYNIENIATEHGINQLEMISDTILRYVNDYKREVITEEQLLEELIKEKTFYNIVLKERIAKEISVRIIKYQSEYFKWYEMVICMGVALIAFFIPYWMILYKKRVLHLNMEDEVNQFCSIIFMMMYIEHMTVKDLLEQMELFAVVFKPSIQECINDFNSGEIEALTRMKEKEFYGPFRRLVDNLIRCDNISIDKAFDEIASDRENYQDRRKQENEILVQKRADIAKPLSFVPAILVTIYLLLPLLLASIKELEEFKESLSIMGF